MRVVMKAFSEAQRATYLLVGLAEAQEPQDLALATRQLGIGALFA